MKPLWNLLGITKFQMSIASVYGIQYCLINFASEMIHYGSDIFFILVNCLCSLKFSDIFNFYLKSSREKHVSKFVFVLFCFFYYLSSKDTFTFN